MAFEKNSGSINKRAAGQGYGAGLVRNTSFRRKRVVLSNICLGFEDDDDDFISTITPLKRQCNKNSFLTAEKTTAIVDLPQEILIRILCGVEHDDLKSLFFVSTAIREATLLAKQSHFAYSTPRKTLIFLGSDFDNSIEVEAPNAPKQSKVPISRLSAKKLAEISVNLFGSEKEVKSVF